MKNLSHLFPETYEKSRNRFQQNLNSIQKIWPNAELSRHVYDKDDDLSTDWIHANALGSNEKVFLLTTGEHGIEGYVGSAMLQRFIENFLPRLDPKTTGLFLLHAINPWGMKHNRRTNANNVDLNRNFVWKPELIDTEFNPEHRDIDGFVNPKRPLKFYWISLGIYMFRLPWYLIKMGFQGFKKTSLLGHYRNSMGVHYGGRTYQDETLLMMRIYREALKRYNQILYLDMHTGYGPRYQMSLVNSVFEEGNSQYFSTRFNYPKVVAVNTDEFYELRGDMLDYLYELRQNEFPEKRLYANSFEFGCYGSSIGSIIKFMLALALENQVYHFGTGNPQIRARVERFFLEAFNPQSEKWREKALADADLAFEGILQAEGYLERR
jgi:hypothetical protein